MTHRKPTRSPWQRAGTRLVVVLVALAGLWAYDRFIKPQELVDATSPVEHSRTNAERNTGSTPRPSREEPQADKSPDSQNDAKAAVVASLIIKDLELRDDHGKVIYRGKIDLAPTLERIAAKRRLRFANDGSTFQNREARLPRRPAGHYREWVVPTPTEEGPGPQRLVTGAEGEVWYTSDHYRTFRRVDYTWPDI